MLPRVGKAIMGNKPVVSRRVDFVGASVGVIASMLGACDVDIPCPGQCFEYTVQDEEPRRCLTGMGSSIDIPFTGVDPDGYHGRFCFNSSSVPLVMDAIDHLRAGGTLSELPVDVQSAYVSTVDAVRADVQAECITAAPGQCTNAAQVCGGIAADMYDQLVVNETCVLEPDGVERITLGPGEVCEAAVEQGTGSAEVGDHCDGTTSDEMAGSSGVDETSG
jgi:hypothetical protein